MRSSLSQQESVLRRINEAIEQGFWPGEADALVRMRCECGRLDCTAFVQMRASEYGRLRAHPRRSVLCPGHETPEIERVVSHRSGHVVVEKTGAAGRAAARSDPRTVDPEDDVS